MQTIAKILKVMYKPYSPDIKGYIFRIADLIYIVINSNLSKADADEAQETLTGAFASASEGNNLILLKGNGQLCKSEHLDILERAC